MQICIFWDQVVYFTTAEWYLRKAYTTLTVTGTHLGTRQSWQSQNRQVSSVRVEWADTSQEWGLRPATGLTHLAQKLLEYFPLQELWGFQSTMVRKWVSYQDPSLGEVGLLLGSLAFPRWISSPQFTLLSSAARGTSEITIFTGFSFRAPTTQFRATHSRSNIFRTAVQHHDQQMAPHS